MLSLREEQKRLTRDRLLDGAVAVFARKSFADATMEDIAGAAEVSRVTVYAHFGGKSDIIQALATRVYDAMGAVYTDLGARTPWSRDTVRDWLGDAADHWRDMAGLLRVVHIAGSAALSSSEGGTAASRGRYIAEHERFAAALTADSGRWRGIPRAEAHQRAVLAVLQSESFLSAWIGAGLTVTAADPLELLTDSICHLLAPALNRQGCEEA